MNKLKITKATAAMILGVAALYGCGGGGSDPVASDIPDRAASKDTTSADISGQALKGSLSNAVVSVTQMNGSPIKITSDNRTDNAGKLSLVVKGEPGFGIDSMFKVTVTADSNTSMVCDAIDCNGVAMGGSVPGSQLSGVKLNTLTYVKVPYASSADSVNDASFQANALTTIATALLDKAVADGKNVSVRQLYELALQEYSDLTLKALGVFAPGSNVFITPLLSAERYENFVVDEKCQEVSSIDADGNPISEKVCADVLVDTNTIKLSLVNAAFANTSNSETLSALFDKSIKTTQTAIEGDATVLEALRQRLQTSVAAVPFLDKLGLNAEQVIDLKLAFFDDNVSSGPVQEITTSANLVGATITARNRISDGESEAKAFDGDPATKWLDHNDWKGAPTAENPAWIQLQFTQPLAASSIFITSANDAPARDPENFNLQASNDGKNWVQLAEFIGQSFDKRFERKEFRFSNGLEYSFYRLNITKNKGDDTLMQLAEIQLVGPIHTSKDHTIPADALTITARNRISDGEAEGKAFDNDPQTKWLDHNDWKGAPTIEDPSWVQVDFPQAVAVDTLAITSANDAPARDPENFVLMGSNDGGNSWTELASWLGESFDSRFQRRLFSVDNILAYSSYRLNITKNKGDDTLMQIAEIELIGPKKAGVNHGMQSGVAITARNRISDGEAEGKAFDGDRQTKWLDHNDWKGAPTVENPSWVQVQLPQPKAVNKLALTSANDAPARDPENFTLLGSSDGEHWTALNSWVGESFDQRFQRKQLSFGNDLGFSYYRLNITKNKGDDTLMQVAEIELIGPEYVSVDHSSTNGVKITARNRISDGEAEGKAFDDDPQTKWLDHNDWKGAPTTDDPSWVQLDLPSAKIVSSLAITSANDAPARDPENFNLQGSNDGGKTWVELGSWIGESFEQRFQRKLFEMGNGFAFSSYRLNITKNKGDDTLMQIAEIELIGPDL